MREGSVPGCSYMVCGFGIGSLYYLVSLRALRHLEGTTSVDCLGKYALCALCKKSSRDCTFLSTVLGLTVRRDERVIPRNLTLIRRNVILHPKCLATQ